MRQAVTLSLGMSMAAVAVLAVGCGRPPAPQGTAAPTPAHPPSQPDKSTGPAVGVPTSRASASKAVLMVIAQRNFRDEELLTPKKAFEGAGFSVTVVAPSTATASGMLGAKVTPGGTIKESDPTKYDAVVFVGGSGATALFDDPDAHRLAKGAIDGGKVVGAICLAPSILARAGLLDGKRATVWESESKTLKAHGATYTGEPVTVDGKLVTANGPDAAARFADELLKQLR